MSTATKTNPELWEKAKSQAKARMGGKHSARAMQLAVKIYKERGGKYKGAKSPTNKLAKWTKQKWTTPSGKPSGQTGEVYAPARTIARLKSTPEGRAKLAQASAKKREATQRGEQYAKHGLHKGKKR